MTQYSFYTLRTRGLVLLAITLVLTIPSLVLLLHSCTVTRVSSSFCISPVVSSTKAADTAHLDEPIDLAKEDQSWANKLPLGGSFSPSRCLPTTRVAVLLPFRDREAHLATFLRKMHPFLQVLFFDRIKVTSLCLQVQGIQYTLVVLNQTGSAPFMRGLLFNAGSNFSPSYEEKKIQVSRKQSNTSLLRRIVLSSMTSTTFLRSKDFFIGILLHNEVQVMKDWPSRCFLLIFTQFTL